MEKGSEHHSWKKHAQDINVIHSYSRLTKSNPIQYWYHSITLIWFDVNFSWSFSWTLKTRPKIGWPPWETQVLELKHLGVYALLHKHDDPFPQARADRSAARSRPDRRAGAHYGWCLKWNAHCARQQFYWPCDVGLIYINPKALVTVGSHVSVMCKLHIEETASSNTQVRSIT